MKTMRYQRNLKIGQIQCQKQQSHSGDESTSRWAPTSYKWSYNPYKWPYKWVTGVITPISEVITLLITGRGPTLLQRVKLRVPDVPDVP